jgi:lipopolysaccharide transport system permease protein
MSASYSDTRIEATGHTLAVSTAVRNESAGPWESAAGFGIGSHIFDPSSGMLIVDGPRAPLDIAPGGSAVAALMVELPEEDGFYRVFVSPMREDVCWFYERGWRFLAIDATVADGRARVERTRVVKLATLRREDMVRSIGRAIVYPVHTIWRNRSLIRTMVRRDILGRYRGSFAGAFWTLLNPLLLMLTYFFVFGVVLQTKFGNDPSRSGFALYFLAGMLPWLAFSEAAGRAPWVMIEHRNFVKKLVFAVETLPFTLVISGLVSEIFALVLFSAGFLIARGTLPLSVVWLPLLILPQILFTAGFAWFLAALGVFVRDLGQVIGFLLTLWFFLTPICYPEASLPAMAAPLLSRNPIYVLVRGYRAVFLEGRAPAFGPLWKLWIVSAAAFVLGHAWFYKLRKSFADII